MAQLAAGIPHANSALALALIAPIQVEGAPAITLGAARAVTSAIALGAAARLEVIIAAGRALARAARDGAA